MWLEIEVFVGILKGWFKGCRLEIWDSTFYELSRL